MSQQGPVYWDPFDRDIARGTEQRFHQEPLSDHLAVRTNSRGQRLVDDDDRHRRASIVRGERPAGNHRHFHQRQEF